MSIAMELRGSGHHWAVFRGANQLSPYMSYDVATARLHRLECAEKRTERPCLNCRSLMISTGPHHRLCDPCRSQVSWP